MIGMKKIKGMISNRDARWIASQVDAGDGCGNCRYYKENRITGRGACEKLKIRTNVLSCCSQWEGKAQA